MAGVRAFRGIRYRLGEPGEAAGVVAPPYDVISPAEQDALHDSHPHNIIRLELPKDQPGDTGETNRYSRAAAQFREWLAAGVLAEDPQSALYLYGQRYETPAGTQERLGLLGALKVEPYEAGVVLPHEQTFPKHKEDRFRLLSTAQAQFSPIFGLYSAPDADVRAHLDPWTKQAPVAIATDQDGVEHRLWVVTDPEFLGWVETMFGGRQVFIADGHHRYETALRYRDHRRAETPDAPDSPFDYVMTFLVEMDDPGLVLLPTHRLLRAPLPSAAELRSTLERHFTIEDVSLEDADRLAHHQLGIVLPGGQAWRLTLRDAAALEKLDQEHSAAWRDLDVVLLHRLVLGEALGIESRDDIVYTRDPAEARSRVLSGEFNASFLLPTPSVEELKNVAGASDKMPEKSTYFWPKAISGLVIYGE